jgi:hypothetical protein
MLPEKNGKTMQNAVLSHPNHPLNRAWPSHHQRLLLKSALLPEADALAAWRQWRAEVDIEGTHPDATSFRLLPLVFDALNRYAVDDPFMARLRGIHRNRWVRNQLVLRGWAAAYKCLAAAAIESLAVGTVALTPRYYQDGGVRPLEPAGLLVRATQVADAVAALTAQGWRPQDGRAAQLVVDAQHVRTQQPFVDEQAQVCVLHWRLADAGDEEPVLEAATWSAAQPVEIEQLHALTFCPADHLHFLCAQAWRMLPPPPLDWLADAVILLRHEGEAMDWPRLLRGAQMSGAAPMVRDVLSYLADELGVLVPGDVLAALAGAPLSAQAQRLYDVWRRTPATTPVSRSIAGRWEIVQHLAALHGGRSNPSFPEFVRLYFGKASQGELVSWAVRRLF